MEALLYFALFAGGIFLMMRFGCGAHVMGHGHGEEQTGDGTPSNNGHEMRWVPPQKDVDPVCGKTVSADKAKPSVFDGHVYYLCSRECREVFEAAPDLYLSKDRSPSGKQMELSHG